jgi:hypothetical protein
MRRFLLAAATVFAIASPAAANTVDLGTIGSAGTTFSDSFSTNTGTGSFTDDYTFKIDGSGTITGSTTSVSLFFANLSLNQIALYQVGSSAAPMIDTSPGSFSFSGLSNGSYILAVSGVFSGLGTAEYSGSIKEQISSTPLPASWTLMILGLMGLGFFAYRRKDQAALNVA